MHGNGRVDTPVAQLLIPEGVREEIVNRIVTSLEARRTAPSQRLREWAPLIVLAVSIFASFITLKTEVEGMKEVLKNLKYDMVPRAEHTARDEQTNRFQENIIRLLDDQSRRIDRLEDHVLMQYQTDQLQKQIKQHDEHSSKKLNEIENK